MSYRELMEWYKRKDTGLCEL